MKSSGIGGQAVLEGVMMRNRSKYAVVVRKPDGELEIQVEEAKSVRNKNILFRIPVIRGVVAFVESLILGIKALTYSSGFLEDEEDLAGADGSVPVAAKSSRRETLENIGIVLVSIIFAILFFMLLPFGVSVLLRGRVHSEVTRGLIEGVLRVVLFLGYVIAISLMSDIRRVFMYHGAEHKTINCVENGQELTVENVRRQSRYHRRCGTSYLFVVMFVSIVCFLFIHIDDIWLRMLYRILLIPVIAGISFEFITFAGNTDNKLVVLLSRPGMWLQKLTTREPDDGMIEVAIQSVEAVFDWREYQAKMGQQVEHKRTQPRKKKRKKKEEGTSRNGLVSVFARKGRKSRSQYKKELAEREERYRNRAAERRRMHEEQEAREAAHERAYQAAKKRKAERLAATRDLPKLSNGASPAPKVEVNRDTEDLKGLDHFFGK